MNIKVAHKVAHEAMKSASAKSFKARRTIQVKVISSIDCQGFREWWWRDELREILGIRSSSRAAPTTPMSEATFKRRLELLELCPEVDRRLYGRKFSDLAKWALIEIEKLHKQFDFNAQKVTEYLETTGLDTSEYFKEKHRNKQNDYQN